MSSRNTVMLRKISRNMFGEETELYWAVFFVTEISICKDSYFTDLGESSKKGLVLSAGKICIHIK